MPARRRETQWRRCLWLPMALLAAVLSGCASGTPERPDAIAAEAFQIRGRVALAAPDIEISERHHDGATLPRGEWTAAARLLCAQAAHEVLGQQAITTVDYGPVGAPRLREHLLAAQGTASASGDDIGAAALQGETTPLYSATGADYGLFMQLRGSHASSGRTAVRAAGRLLLGADIGGDTLDAEAWLVDLRSGRVVWRHQLAAAKTDLRTLAGARSAVATLLAGLHGPGGTPGP